jgi:hypothetical protein
VEHPGETYPRTGFLLSVLGGALVAGLGALEVLVLTLDESQVRQLGYSSPIVATATGAAVFATVLGAGVLFFAGRIRSRPPTARRSGAIVLLLSVLSIIGGGGLFVGAILGAVGGAVAYRWKAPPLPNSPSPWGGTNDGAPSAAPTSPTPPRSGPGRVCPFCGAANPASAQFCARCGGRFPR